ncbi:class I fructose-bisphosphate aldolase [Nakamurella endophytica]|uniref:Aldolase n=1 Tax=Nakamurella endophytica TaxID=1748367 RepID=A0A917T7R4_9ACTN|nr:aldolase [Nakamurella endophytica]GGM10947.1 aldolase [Nakamurella endophytica]
MSTYRLQRLFHPRSGRLLDVAVDHGFFGEPAFLSGIRDMRTAIDVLVDAAPDAIQLTAGQAPLLQDRPGRVKPSLVLRSDVANVYGPALPDRLYSLPIQHAAETAARLDAACLVVNVFDMPGQPELREQCVRNVLALRPECTALGIPLMVEPLVMRANNAGGAYLVDGDVDRITALVRQAVELGADLIKADPTDDISRYHEVVEVAGHIPVLVRGGGRVPDDQLLQRTVDVLAQGARGIVYGRNIIAHRDPAGITRALMAVLHDDASVSDALALVGAA